MNQPENRSPSRDATLADKLFALLLYLLPHHLLSQMMYWLTRQQWAPLKDLLIKGVIRLYRVDMSLAEEPDPEHYPSFNAFFTRRLKADARPLDDGDDSVISPVDGTVSQCGSIRDGRIFQAKGQSFDLAELLGEDGHWCEQFADGEFATIYLSPRDYHRIHMPVSGSLQQMTHIPGRLFSVSPSTTRVVPRLFSRNERVVNLFQTEQGAMGLVMVGAIFVASMDTVWAGTVAPLSRRLSHWHYPEQAPNPVSLKRGSEMGRFNMGSTVILLFPKGSIEWEQSMVPGSGVQMGGRIARRL